MQGGQGPQKLPQLFTACRPIRQPDAVLQLPAPPRAETVLLCPTLQPDPLPQLFLRSLPHLAKNGWGPRVLKTGQSFKQPFSPNAHFLMKKPRECGGLA